MQRKAAVDVAAASRILMALLLLSLLSLLAAGRANHTEPVYTPFCDPSVYSDDPSEPFPTLPEQFSTVVEANLGQFNLTIVVKEYYDDIDNRGKMIFSFNDTDEMAIFDYDDQEIFLIPDRLTGSPCAVRLIGNSDQFLNRTFGFRYVNGSVHIGSVQALFNIYSGQPLNYTDTSEARGIPTNTWETCFAEENNSYVLTYHFATEDWAYAHNIASFPVQITLRGRRVNSKGELEDLDHVYSFVDFNDVVSDEDFQVPIGLPCRGRVPGQETEGPSLPDYYSTFIEVEDLNNRTSSLIREYYDYDHNLFRLDVYYDGSRGGTEGPYTVIENFDIEVRYIINRRLSNCSIFALSSNLSLFESEVGESGNLQLKSPRDLLFLSNDFNYSYEGVTTVRGVEVDVWISLRDSVELGGANLSNAVIEWYFTRPGWELETDISKTTDPTPWRLKLSGIISYVNSSTNALVTEDFNKEYDIIGFSTIEPSFDAFDTSICISPENYHILTMVVPGHEAGVTDLGQFRRSIRTAITEFAGINPLQVGSIEIVGENGTHIFVTLHLSSLPGIATTTTTPKTADEILQLILDETKDGRLPFRVALGSGPAVSPTILRVNEESDSCSDKDVSIGQAAGFAVGMLALGIFLGILLVLAVYFIGRLCCFRRRPAVVSSVKYEKHEDDS